MKKIRFSSILISVAVVLIIFITALNFYKKEPIYSYTLTPKIPYIESDVNLKQNDIIIPDDAEQTITESKNNNIIEDDDSEALTIPGKDITGTFYYTKSGTKWHSSKDCRYLANSKEILESTFDKIEERELSPCSACAASFLNTQNTNENQEAEEDNNETNIYYYTESGTKWHIDKECRYIKNSKKILEGDYKAVEGRGLSPCSGCAQ